MSRKLTREEVIETVDEVLTAEYGGNQTFTARRIVQALEDEGLADEGWTA